VQLGLDAWADRRVLVAPGLVLADRTGRESISAVFAGVKHHGAGLTRLAQALEGAASGGGCGHAHDGHGPRALRALLA
jgi:hypothetical protein